MSTYKASSTAMSPPVEPLPARDYNMMRSAVADTDDKTSRHRGEVRKLTSLLDVSQALSNPVSLKTAFHRVLELLERYHGTARAVIALPAEEGRRLHLHASIGVRGNHSDAPLGGTLAQQVFESGRPVVVPRVSREPALGSRRVRNESDERTYICVPVQQSRKCRGVLEVELAFRSDRNYDRTMKFYGVVGSMLAQALKMQALLDADRQRLVDENVRLRDELRER